MILELKAQLLCDQALQSFDLIVFKLKNLPTLIAGQVVVVVRVGNFVTSRTSANP